MALRAVEPDEKPERPKAKSVTQAAADGSQKELLVALRERLSKTIDDPKCPARDLAALTRRLQDIGRDIEAIEAREKQEAAEDADSSRADDVWDAEAL